ncbi:hypothetical protein KI387_032873, partial [Taxus chinensis]
MNARSSIPPNPVGITLTTPKFQREECFKSSTFVVYIDHHQQNKPPKLEIAAMVDICDNTPPSQSSSGLDLIGEIASREVREAKMKSPGVATSFPIEEREGDDGRHEERGTNTVAESTRKGGDGLAFPDGVEFRLMSDDMVVPRDRSDSIVSTNNQLKNDPMKFSTSPQSGSLLALLVKSKSMASTSTCGHQLEDTQITYAFEGIVPALSSKTMKKLPYDVFINHRGPNVKYTLASSIYRILNGMTLTVFLDSEELDLGNFLPREIEAVTRRALLHIAIFSPKYAESPWCLAELSFMLKTGTPIVPVFYYVDPADLRWVDKGKGGYAPAFFQHEEKGRYTPEMLQDWKKALYEVSFYCGHIITNKAEEWRVLKNIVNDVLREVKHVPLVVAKHPVGLEETVKDFEMTALQSTQLGHESVKIVGIWGMGGSGKTTLAKQIYNDKCASMERSSFLFDVRDAAGKNVLHNKQKKLLEDLGVKGVSFDNMEEGKGILARCLRSVRVLVILDDVDHMDQLDALLPTTHSLGLGSLIIVTTRELQVLQCWGISSIYKMKTLDLSHAKQLFCWHAFLQPSPPDTFEELVEKFLAACNGLPLSLKVFGGQLYGISRKDYWESQLHKLSRILPNDVKQRLKISYDALDDEEKEIFLDAVCFFIGEENSLAIEVWNGSGWSGLHSWETLVNKCLVELDEKNRIRIHDHLRDLGREIASQHSPRRIWLPEQVTNVQNETEKRTGIRGIMATTAESTGEVDEGLCGLAASSLGLKIFVVRGPYFNQVISTLASTELVWLRCIETGQRNLPSPLSLKKLRVLQLHEKLGREYHLEELWEADEDAPRQLRELVISACRNFQRFPNSIGYLKNLKKLVMDGRNSNVTSLPNEFCLLLSLEHLQLCCEKLSLLPSRFGDLTNLRHLDLSGCSTLRMLPVCFKQLTILHYLNFHRCSKLIFNLDIMENMTKLEYLNLSFCKELEELPSHITNQASLRELYMEHTRSRELPMDIGQLSKLQVMHIGNPLLTSLPHSIGNLSSLINLKIYQCPELESLPESVGYLSLLEYLGIWRSGVQSLPQSIRQLTNLQTLNISECPIRKLDFGQGPFTSSLCNLKEISLRGTSVSKISISEDCCPSLETLEICNDDNLTEIEALPRTVKDIRLENCKMAKNIRGFGGLVNLQKLRITSCPELQELPSFAESTSLRKFELIGYYKAVTLEGLEQCRSLEVLRADTNWEVPGIETLEHMDRLRRLQLTTNIRSAVEPCIQTLK